MSILRHKQIDPYDTGSFLLTASVNLNIITFTKGNGSTFPIIVNTGSGGDFVPSSWTGSNSSQFAGTASYVSGSVFTGTNPALTASYSLTASVVLNPYPINVTGSLFSTLYSVEPPSFQNGNPANTDASIFFGYNTGFNAGRGGTAKYVVAIGAGAGANNVNGNTNGSNFIGASAGDSSLYASQSNFIGWLAGYFAYYAPNSNFIGYQAGAYQSIDFIFTNILNGAYSNYIGHQAGIGYYDTTSFSTYSPGVNNTIIGTNLSLPNNISNYVNLGGAFFISGAYSNTASVNPTLGYSSNILTESINTAKVGINLWNPSYSLHVSGTVSFPNLTNTAQTNVVTFNPTTGQLFYSANVLSIPTPKIVLKGIAPLQWLSGSNEPGGTFNLYRTPKVIANDLPLELINTYPTFVEMVYHKTNRKGKSWVVPVSNVDTGGGTYVNTLESTLGVPLKTRGGIQKYKMSGNTIPAVYTPLQINRPNHYQVTGSNQVIPVYEYLNGYFALNNVQYRTQLSPFEDFSDVRCLYPYFAPQTHGQTIGAGYSYSSIYSPLYIAFRYILWDANANNGLGEFISGPLSKTVAIAAPVHPFITNKNNANVLQPLASINPNFTSTQLKCWFSHKIG